MIKAKRAERVRTKNVLYTVPGSSTCQKAESHLRSLGVEFEVIVVGATDELENIGRDMEVQRLPFLVTPERTYQGMKEIIGLVFISPLNEG